MIERAAGTLPPLPLEERKDAKNNLHRFVRIVDKIRLDSPCEPLVARYVVLLPARASGSRS